MTRPARSACVLAVLTLLLAGCAQTPVNEMGATAAAAAAAPADAPPMERHEASAQCWMKYDKSGGTLEAKAKLVDKCIAEKTKPGAKP